MNDRMDVVWRLFRALRSDPPGRAGRGERRHTFSAGLSQAEELWRASAVVTHEVAPILLFYGLTQAARAVHAAGFDGPRWQAVPSHGLRLDPPSVPRDASPRLSDVRVISGGDRQGFCQQFAEWIGARHPPDECTLAAILAQLPEHDELLFDCDEPRPLQIHNRTPYRSTSPSPSSRVALLVGPVPNSLVHFEERADGVKAGLAPEADRVLNWLSTYPSLHQAGLPDSVRAPEPLNLDSSDAGYAVELEWILKDEIPWGANEWFEEIADVVHHRGAGIGSSGLALPAIDTPPTVLEPILSWWIGLFATSMLARYYPTTWARLTDVDESLDAVPLTTFLDLARREVPALLLESLVTE